MRDDFPKGVRVELAARVGFQCSNPSCRALTIGPHADPTKSVNVGVAAHISAASPGGPRYDPSRSADERCSIQNGIWLCQTCAKLVDSDQIKYSDRLLYDWKRLAEVEALRRLGIAKSGLPPAKPPLDQEETEILIAAADRGEVFLQSSDQTGKWVAAGASDFLNLADPAVAAAYTGAMKSLLDRGLLRHEGGSLYALSPSGFKIARQLRARPIQEGIASVSGSEFVKFEPMLPYTPRLRPTHVVWHGRGDLYNLEITDVSSTGFRAILRSKATGEIPLPGWAKCTFNWIAEPTD